MNIVYLKLRILKFENNKRRFKNKIRKTMLALMINDYIALIYVYNVQ